MADPAVRVRPGAGPALLFLPGYRSDMAGAKALALDAWAARIGRALVRFDYRGCGESGGRFEDFTLDDWLADAAHAAALVDGPLVPVGSSMGGWLALLLAERLGSRIAGLVGIAAAPDFTDWGYTDAEKATIRDEGLLRRPSPYGDDIVTTRAFWESGQRRLLLGRAIAVDAPVRLLQGQRDAEVPWSTAARIAGRVRSADVQTLFVKDGDHRLSRDADIALLIRTVEALPEPA